MLKLIRVEKSNPNIKQLMKMHYSHPGGFVGRQIMYGVLDNDKFLGAIAGGSSTLHLPGRNEFFGDKFELNKVVNNTFFHLLPNDDKYLGTKVLKLWREQVVKDWTYLYEEEVIGFETLVELPRTGALYKADNWTFVGTTKGYTCRRIAPDATHLQTENWGGVRVWNYTDLKPKLVFCKINKNVIIPKERRRLF